MDKKLVLPHLIERRANDEPDRMFLRDTSMPSLTYGQTQVAVLTRAFAYRRVGIAAGDTVSVMMPTRPDGIISWLGLAWLGALDCRRVCRASARAQIASRA